MATTDPRQLIVLCDGTNNTLTGGSHDTNVLKLLEHIRQQPKNPRQIVFYDPGVGSSSSLPGVTLRDNLSRLWDRVEGLATGRGIYENIAQCYEFLMHHYHSKTEQQAADQIFLFGFSRGSFTARCIAGLINQFGLLEPHMAHLVPTLIQIYFGKRDDGVSLKQLTKIRDQVVQLFVDVPSKEVDIQFIGVWDTVDSVGIWPFNLKMSSVPTVDPKKTNGKGKHFLNIRHAMALDEHRYQFRARPYIDHNGRYTSANGHPVTLEQQWFPGSHCDVGGGNDSGQTTLSNIALDWLVNEAITCGLAISPITATQNAQNAGQLQEPYVIHSEIYETPLWALTGLHVRETQRVELDNGKVYRPSPVAHPNTLTPLLKFSKDTVWAAPHPETFINVWCMLVILILLGMSMQTALHQTIEAFAIWQLGWWHQNNLTSLLKNFSSPRTAILLDFAFIAAYVGLLAPFVTRAFANLAGLNKISAQAKKWLNVLGWALPLMVFADVFENILTLTLLSTLPTDTTELHLSHYALALAMSIASAAKLVGFGGVIALILAALPRSLLHHVQRR